jgi:hypothetical protein
MNDGFDGYNNEFGFMDMDLWITEANKQLCLFKGRLLCLTKLL